jgi:hypothetical protein
MVALAILLVVVGGGAVLLLTQDDDDDREAYVDAVTLILQHDSELSAAEARCIADVAVDVGGDSLRDAVTPEEISEAPSRDLGDHGVRLDDQQGNEFFDGVGGCIDLRQLLLDGLAELGPGVSDCVDAALNDDLFRRVMVASFVDGDNWQESNPELAGEFETTVGHCEP